MEVAANGALFVLVVQYLPNLTNLGLSFNAHDVCLASRSAYQLFGYPEDEEVVNVNGDHSRKRLIAPMDSRPLMNPLLVRAEIFFR